MSVIISPPYLKYNIISETESKELSKQRIIQKNLVHFQGFPDRLYNKKILASEEFFGQYGLITQIILTNKTAHKAKKRSNSAYISFYTCEQAAYAVLSVDSIKIDIKLVRACFGTTKYCSHFLNNFKCFKSDKCMFLHEIANINDIITENTKFGYTEHIKLAKEIIGYGSIRSQMYIRNHTNKNRTVLPTISTIYQKNDIIIKTQNHRRKKSNENNNMNNLNNNSNNETQSSSNSFHSNSSNDSNYYNNENNNNKEISIYSLLNEEFNKNNNNSLFKSKNKSRFNFVNNNMDINKYKNEKIHVPKIMKDVVDELCSRISFFIPMNKYKPIKNLEINFCNNILSKVKDEDLKNIITNSLQI